jgi:outer membrane protein TolC
VEITIGMPAELLRRRPDVRRAERLLAAQSALIGVAVTDLFPRLSLVGSIGFRTSDAKIDAGVVSFENELGDLFDSDSFTSFVGPFVSWNIFNYGRIKNNVRAQDARFQQLVVRYQNVVLNAAREVEDGLVGFLRSQEQVGYLEKAVAASQRSVELSLDQYEGGLADYQRVLNSQSSLLIQQDSLARVRGQVVSSLVSTYRALGGGWQLREGNAFVDTDTLETMRERTDWGNLIDQ